MVFLKEADNGKNLYQFTLAADMSYQPGATVERLVLLRHDYPIELEDTNRDDPRNAARDPARDGEEHRSSSGGSRSGRADVHRRELRRPSGGATATRVEQRGPRSNAPP